jgi:hypothetical protein
MSEDVEILATRVIETAMGVHIDVGPGLLDPKPTTACKSTIGRHRFSRRISC